jgi:hypothetical protein
MLALVLSIVAWVACGIFLSIPALIIAKREINGIHAGARDPANLGNAKAAYWVSIIQIVVNVLAILTSVILLVVFYTMTPQPPPLEFQF